MLFRSIRLYTVHPPARNADTRTEQIRYPIKRIDDNVLLPRDSEGRKIYGPVQGDKKIVEIARKD